MGACRRFVQGALPGTILSGALVLGWAETGRAQDIDVSMSQVDGTVRTVAYGQGRIYLAGDFTSAFQFESGGIPFDAATGDTLAGFPIVDGDVSAAVSDGAGGWYIGGYFTDVGGVPRSNLAHVASDLSVSPWNPNPNGFVGALVLSGTTLYVGGGFTEIGGAGRNYIAAVDATTGAVSAWDPDQSGQHVYALAVNGSMVYAAMNGILDASHRVAAFDAGPGAATVWSAEANIWLGALAASGSVVYVGGAFTHIGGVVRNWIAALDATTGVVTDWNPQASPGINSGFVFALAVSGSIVYAGGSFTQIGGASRNRIAAIDASTGLATAWNPDAASDVHDLVVHGSVVYAAGSFSSIGGAPHRGFVAIDAATGAPTEWTLSIPPTGGGGAVAVSGSAVYAGAQFRWGGQVRYGTAAFDATSGAVTDWYPCAYCDVNALAVSGSTVFAGGNFTEIGGQSRNNFAALDATTGAATDWSPNPEVPSSITVYALALSGSTIFVGGGYTTGPTIGVGWIAGFDLATGARTFLNESGNLPVFALTVSGSTVYAGGRFTNIGTQGWSYLAALDATTGEVLDWNPGADGQVDVLAVGGSTLYVGGSFAHLGGANRSRIAAFDATTRTLTDWDPGANAAVGALAVDGMAVYAGGSFSTIGGQPRNGIAALDASTGEVKGWNPNVGNGGISALAVSGSTLYAGGAFNEIGGMPRHNFVAISIDDLTPVLLSLASAHATPDRVDLTWYAPAGDVLTATVYRRTEPGDWEVVGRILADGTGSLRYRDADVSAGARYGYRLGIMDRGEEVFAGETWVDVPGPDLPLAIMGLNPSVDGRLRVELALRDAGPARLDVVDVAGRVVCSRQVAHLGAGRHTVDIAEGVALSPGIYFLRLAQGGVEVRARAAVLK